MVIYSLFPVEKCLGQNQSDHNSEQCLMASYFRHQQLQQTIHAEKEMNNVTHIHENNENIEKTHTTLNEHPEKTITNKLKKKSS